MHCRSLLLLIIAFGWLLPGSVAMEATQPSDGERLRDTLESLESAYGIAAVVSTLILMGGLETIRELVDNGRAHCARRLFAHAHGGA